MARKSRHPFEGARKRERASPHKYRLWTGFGAERVPAGLLPVRALVAVSRVPSLSFANRVIAQRTGGRVAVRRLNAPGLTYDESTGTWWLVTNF